MSQIKYLHLLVNLLQYIFTRVAKNTTSSQNNIRHAAPFVCLCVPVTVTYTQTVHHVMFNKLIEARTSYSIFKMNFHILNTLRI